MIDVPGIPYNMRPPFWLCAGMERASQYSSVLARDPDQFVDARGEAVASEEDVPWVMVEAASGKLHTVASSETLVETENHTTLDHPCGITEMPARGAPQLLNGRSVSIPADDKCLYHTLVAAHNVQSFQENRTSVLRISV